MSGTLPHETHVSMAALHGETSLVRELTAGGLSGANAATFDELIRLIQLSQGRHSFSLVECNSPVLRDKVLKNLALVFPGLQVVSIGPETYSILDFVVHEIGQSSPSTVVIVGIETLLQRVERYEPALARLNYSRDGWREELRCPTIFWLPEFAAIALTRDCPDLLRMITTRFRFEADGESSATVPNLESPLREPRTESMATGNEAAAASDWSTVEMDSAIRAGFEAFEADLEQGDLPRAESRLRDLQRQVGLGLDRHTFAEDGWERLIFFEKQALLAQRLHDSRLEARSWEMAYRIAKDRLERDKSVPCVRHAAWIARCWATNRMASGDTQQGLSLALDSLNILETATASLPCEPRLSQDLATTLDLVARIQVVLGHSDAAWHALNQAYEIRSGLVTIAPDEVDYQRDLSVSLSNMGDLYVALGSCSEARDALEKSLYIDRKLVAAEPDRADYHRDLAISLNKMGDLCRAMGDGPAAQDAFQESLDIFLKLAASKPARADYQRDLSVSYDRMGDLYTELGNDPAARDAFHKSLEIARRLAAAEPDRADYQRDVSISLNKMGDLFLSLGFGQVARDAFEESLSIRQKLAATEPNRADYQRDLSVSYDRIGDLYRALGDGPAARDAFEKSLSTRQKLAAAEPNRADYQRDLSIALIKMGDLYSALGNGRAAHEAFGKSLGIARSLAAAEKDRLDYQRDLSLLYDRMGDLYSAQGDALAARNAFEKSLEITQRLATAEPHRVDYQRDLSVLHDRMGDLYRAMGDGPAARGAFENSLSIRQQLAKSGRADCQRDLYVSFMKMGDLFRYLGDSPNAHEAFQKSLDIALRLAEAEPDRADHQVDLASSLCQIARFTDDPGEPLRMARQILEKLDQTGRLAPVDRPKLDSLRQILPQLDAQPLPPKTHPS